MEDNMRVITTEEELKVFSDPYRMKIIKAYQSLGIPLTVKQVADHLNEVPAKVHYHVKKLIAIEVLALDHIEVINGINAKYYYLPKTSFTVRLEDAEAEEMYKQLNSVESMLFGLIDQFKKDFAKTAQFAVEKEVHDETDVGILTSKDLYLSEEECIELNDLLVSISNKYGKYDPEKKSYSFLAGFTRKFDEKK